MTIVPDGNYPRAYLVRVGDTDQSYVDLDDPRRLEFDYVERIADALDAVVPAGQRVRIVHVGGAAMTLGRYVVATRPQSAQIVLEPDTELTALMREHLPLPERSGIKVRGLDGRAGLAEMRDAYADVVVVDAFAGAQVPPELTTREWFQLVRRVLTPAGLLIMNLTDRAPFDYGRRVWAGVAEAFAEVAVSAEPATLKGRRFGNVIVLGRDQPLPTTALAQNAASSAFPYRVIAGARLQQLVAGAAPFSDADSEASPPPPGAFLG